MIEEDDDFAPLPSPFSPEVLAELEEAGWFNQSVPRWHGARCAHNPEPDLWHRGDHASQQEAIAICGTCPTWLECRRYGLTQREGVWGGIALRPAKPPSSELRPLDAFCKKCGGSEWAERKKGRECLPCKRSRERARWEATKKEKELAQAL